MYHLTLTRPGHPDEHRTAHSPGEIRNAVWDLVRAHGWVIRDEDHTNLIAAAGQARDTADIYGSSITYADGAKVYALPIEEAKEDPDVTPRLIIRADNA